MAGCTSPNGCTEGAGPAKFMPSATGRWPNLPTRYELCERGKPEIPILPHYSVK